MNDDDSNAPVLNPKKRGLGRGLGALFEDEEVGYTLSAASAPAPATLNKLQTLGIDQLRPGKFQPRQNFRNEELDELAASIRSYGLLQPLLVRPDTQAGAESYEIVAGERRWRAAQKAGIHSVPVIIKVLDDFQALEIGLIENLQRTDLGALEEARAFERLMRDFAYTHADVAEHVGKSRSYITNMTRLLTLPPSVQEMLDQDLISTGHARALINADEPHLLGEWVQMRKLSVRELEELIATRREEAERKAGRGSASGGTGHGKPKKDADMRALEKRLSDALGMRVTLEARGQTGALKINFKTLDQLDTLLDLLSGSPQDSRLQA